MATSFSMAISCTCVKFNCKLKLQFQISNCNFMNLKLNLNCELKLNVGQILQVHFKGKMGFSVAYGLHRFQIQFHLQIEIAISNFKLQLKFICTWYIHYMIFKLNFNYKLKLQFEISNCKFILQMKLNVGQFLAISLKRESGF